jgi:hypothetical protein
MKAKTVTTTGSEGEARKGWWRRFLEKLAKANEEAAKSGGCG